MSGSKLTGEWLEVRSYSLDLLCKKEGSSSPRTKTPYPHHIYIHHVSKTVLLSLEKPLISKALAPSKSVGKSVSILCLPCRPCSNHNITTPYENTTMGSGSDYFWLWKELPRWLSVRKLPAMQETRVQSLGWENPLEKEMATLSSTLAREIPWTNVPNRLQSTGVTKVQH